jgi:hypothetical protein
LEHAKQESLPISLERIMSGPAKSSFVYGVYAVVSGGTLLLKPYFVLGVLGMSPACEGWVRMLGMFLFVLGIYYIAAARKEMIEYFELSVFGRLSVMVFMTIFVWLGFVPRILILLGVIDLFAGVWTFMALRSQRNGTQAAT